MINEEALREFTLSIDWLVIAAIALVTISFLAAMGFLLRLLRRRRRVATPVPELQRVDVVELGDEGPPAGMPRVEIYGTPVRIAAIIIAPLGRGSLMPSPTTLPEVLESVVPGLQQAMQSHESKIVTWPEQLSWHGFSQAFFTHVPLPGDRGKGSPWSSVAGKFTADEVPFVIGLICRAASSNSIGQIIVEREGQWLDILRVRAD